jgi:hypothetical protein
MARLQPMPAGRCVHISTLPRHRAAAADANTGWNTRANTRPSRWKPQVSREALAVSRPVDCTVKSGHYCANARAWSCGDSNPGPAACKTAALPPELQPLAQRRVPAPSLQRHVYNVNRQLKRPEPCSGEITPCKAGALPTELHPRADLQFCVALRFMDGSTALQQHHDSSARLDGVSAVMAPHRPARHLSRAHSAVDPVGPTSLALSLAPGALSAVKSRFVV